MIWISVGCEYYGLSNMKNELIKVNCIGCGKPIDYYPGHGIPLDLCMICEREMEKWQEKLEESKKTGKKNCYIHSGPRDIKS